MLGNLRAKILLFCVICLYFGHDFCYCEDIPAKDISIFKVLENDDQNIDLGYACLVLAKDFYPELDLKNTPTC